MTPDAKKAIAKLVKAIEKEQTIISRSRDRLRDLISDATDICEDITEGLKEIDRGLDAISRLQ